LLTTLEMSDGFRREIAELRGDRIHDVTPEVGPLRRLIRGIAASHALVALSTGPLHLAGGLGLKPVGIYCRCSLSRAEHRGALGPSAISVQVPEESCGAPGGAHKDSCGIEGGIDAGDVLAHLDIGALPRQGSRTGWISCAGVRGIGRSSSPRSRYSRA
jgi:hypothetical protein